MVDARKEGMRAVQTALAGHGFTPGVIDGIGGPKTADAFRRFLAAAGLPFDVTATADSLTATGPLYARPKVSDALPWIAEARSVLGLHERLNNAELASYMASDGRTLGDPAQLPWCGDFIETTMRLALPDEPLTGRVGENPYLARNWLEFGVECGEVYGAVGVAWRGSRHGMSGHVFYAVGQTDTAIIALGGNQGNRVSEVPISRDRILGFRWPKTHPSGQRPLPLVTDAGALSTNEA